jgi:hypothetical protein
VFGQGEVCVLRMRLLRRTLSPRTCPSHESQKWRGHIAGTTPSKQPRCNFSPLQQQQRPMALGKLLQALLKAPRLKKRTLHTGIVKVERIVDLSKPIGRCAGAGHKDAGTTRAVCTGLRLRHCISSQAWAHSCFTVSQPKSVRRVVRRWMRPRLLARPHFRTAWESRRPEAHC